MASLDLKQGPNRRFYPAQKFYPRARAAGAPIAKETVICRKWSEEKKSIVNLTFNATFPIKRMDFCAAAKEVQSSGNESSTEVWIREMTGQSGKGNGNDQRITYSWEKCDSTGNDEWLSVAPEVAILEDSNNGMSLH
eukprot:GHVU01211203.1.p1 GENE.GHVU01211203.1~~GHVU01211203.1.p1  ORF type:complete len:137 (-),score=14.79 GHVU01211203.1:154-564(-)